MKRYSIGNIVLFVVLAVAIFGGWWLWENVFFPKPPAPPPTTPEVKEAKPPREALLALTGGSVAWTKELKEFPSQFKEVAVVKPPEPPKPADPTDPHRLIALNGEGYNLRVLVTNRGGGVQQVILPAFDQASRVGGAAKNETGPYPLELVPGYYRPLDKSTVKADGQQRQLNPGVVGKDTPSDLTLTPASYTISHYDDPDEKPFPHPTAALANRMWAVVKVKDGKPADDGQEVVVRKDEAGNETEREVVFETTVGEPYHLKIRKTFTLSKLDFHVRMKLDFTATADRPAKGPKFHYQIAGPRNVPVEGEWYSATLRNAIVGWKTPSGYPKRDIQDAAHITTEWGGNKVEPQGNTFTFAAVINQFFASAVAIDPTQPEDVRKGLWAYVRPTREWVNHPADKDESPEARAAYYADKPQLGDITVRVAANPIDPTADKPVEHRYWLYNGPTKVRLLKSLHLLDKDHQGFTADANAVDNQYIGDLGLNVMTDAPSPNWFGGIAGSIGWTDLVVWFTNRMHDILGWMHGVVPVWGLNIIMLTVMVRLLLMLPSRRQQASMLKMQEKMAAMKPQLDKLAEQYKNDPQRLNQEKTKLMLQHGVNPLSSMGGCLLMFAQMPVFLGLYYCLQESIFFRLDNFAWIQNLAAPDMLFTWSESIPFVSTADQVGHSWYLGPFVNILPVVAVALMYLNFKVSSPPPTDEQQAMSQKTMKFMMLFMGVFFYKMAAGLCVYFICSTLWGLTERWLLKRKKKKMEADIAAGVIPPPGPSLNTPAKPAGPPKPPGFFEKVKQGLMEKLEEAQRQAESQGRQIVNNPQDKPAPPKPPQGGGHTPGTNGTGKKKKKRKK